MSSEKKFTLPCRVMLDGAKMEVMASNEQEAREKAQAGEWSNIHMSEATLTRVVKVASTVEEQQK
jgi:cell division protein FtsL